jgi:hypothetical protein
MENIGDGASVPEMEKSSTVEPLTHSHQNDSLRTKKTKKPTTPAEAAQILQSALSYCLEAGLPVEVFSEEQDLTLCIRGLQYADESIIVTPVEKPIGVTIPAGVTVQ